MYMLFPITTQPEFVIPPIPRQFQANIVCQFAYQTLLYTYINLIQQGTSCNHFIDISYRRLFSYQFPPEQ